MPASLAAIFLPSPMLAAQHLDEAAGGVDREALGADLDDLAEFLPRTAPKVRAVVFRASKI